MYDEQRIAKKIRFHIEYVSRVIDDFVSLPENAVNDRSWSSMLGLLQEALALLETIEARKNDPDYQD